MTSEIVREKVVILDEVDMLIDEHLVAFTTVQ